ncbi:kinase-like domain-containing protein [Chaetomium strumarium]|uniref:calcium/calmodulin-dependent protein kinase n=1 Tax=Chaetomium strumarium TaxID=1170767 RepID=A0AAJ0GS22_9PEZI|nr:kinase-like domain-containing protein [Chaetomium strumarium]
MVPSFRLWLPVSLLLNRLHRQPENHEKKSKYRFGRILGAGIYGTVWEAEGPSGLVAVKVVPKEELEILQRLKHPHIVKLIDWFKSKNEYYIVTELATGGELFDRICLRGQFTEKDASQTVKQILSAVNYLHQNNVVHRDLKPENLLYLTADKDSDLVVADFGIAKTLGSEDEVLTTMAGSFGYTAPEVLLNYGHGKPVDIWSLGIITYTLLCGYLPFRSKHVQDLIEECCTCRVVFHEKHWKDVSDDAKDFILKLLRPKPQDRLTSEQALAHTWLRGETAMEHNLLPEGAVFHEAFPAKLREMKELEQTLKEDGAAQEGSTEGIRSYRG